MLDIMKNNKVIKLSDRFIALPDFHIDYSPIQTLIHNKLISEFTASGYDVKTPDELSALFEKKEKREFEQVFESMLSNNELIMLSKQVYWQRSDYEKAIGKVKEHFKNEDEITLAQCRDMLGTSRKYALAFLEHLDGKQVTKQHGDVRKLLKGFE